MTENADLVVVGGGPIGGYVASNIASKGFNVSIFEEHKTVGEPSKCAGLVTSRVFDFVNISDSEVIQNEIKGAEIFSPNGNSLIIGGNKVHALVINRTRFDQEIINQAISENAKLLLKNRVTSVQRRVNKIELKTTQKLQIICDLVVGADGAHSVVRDRFGFPNPKEMLKGIGADLTGTNLDPDFVKIFLGNDIAPGFFAWIIPTNDSGTKCRVGLCADSLSPHSILYYFSQLFKQKYGGRFLENAKIVKKIGGKVPLGPLDKSATSNIMLVGDAAGQVKPTSGGGIYTGLLCGKHCISVAIDAMQKQNYSVDFLKKYHKLWFFDIGKELNMGMMLRNVYKRLSDQQFDKYIEKFQKPKILEVINSYGDIDYPSKLIRPMLKHIPSLLTLLPSLIKK
jgi:geranylgeranyl reductase family protein